MLSEFQIFESVLRELGKEIGAEHELPDENERRLLKSLFDAGVRFGRDNPQTLAEEITRYPTIEGDACVSCGNRWWFNQSSTFKCTTCGKTEAKP